MNTIKIEAPLGYTIEQKSIWLPIEKTEAVLSGRQQARFTRAERDEHSAKLVSHFIRCPYCNNKVFAYAKDMRRAFGVKAIPDVRVPKPVIEDWTSTQLSFFDEPFKPLELNTVIDVCDELVCPACSNTIKYSEGKRNIEISRKRHKVYICAEILDVFELFSMPYISGKDINVSFPLREKVCFNFNNGHCYIRLEAPDGTCIAVRDLTNQKNEWNSGAVYSVILDNKYVRRAVKNMFSAEWKKEIPFFSSELDINKMKMLTRFIGFDREFYSSIPFDKGSFKIDESFKSGNKIHRAEDAVKLFNKSKLPKIKSVKRIFFKSPGLIFYIDECEKLWDIIKDSNYFTAILRDKSIYQFLSYLHIYPATFDFIGDYVSVMGTKIILKTITEYWNRFSRYAINYSSMSSHMKKAEREKWKKDKQGSLFGAMPTFAIPMSATYDAIRDCTIDGFEFSWLKTSADYAEAGEQLNNCLVDWEIDNSPVVCVKQHGKIIAALEVRNDVIFQAYSKNNEPLRRVPGLLSAYYRWYEKNNLSEFTGETDFDFLDDLDLDDIGMPF